MFLDLDRFKRVNETPGHQVGDMLLQQVAERLRNTVREIATKFRGIYSASPGAPQT